MRGHHDCTPQTGRISDRDLRSIAARMKWEAVQRPPTHGSDFVSSSCYEFCPEDEQRLVELGEQLEASGRAEQLRVQKRAPPCPYLDRVALLASQRR